MKKIATLMILCLIIALSGCSGGSGGSGTSGTSTAIAAPEPAINAFDMPYVDLRMTGACIFNSLPFPADGKEYAYDVINNTGRTVELRIVREWHGVSMNGYCDFHSQVNRLSDWAQISVFQ